MFQRFWFVSTKTIYYHAVYHTYRDRYLLSNYDGIFGVLMAGVYIMLKHFDNVM